MKRAQLLDAWYRAQIRGALPAILSKWTTIMGVNVRRVFVQRMKTKWGSCTVETRRIWFNLELIKKPPHCLEYILVHEMVHFLERRHGERFVALMSKFLPQWQLYREELNRAPLGHVTWEY